MKYLFFLAPLLLIIQITGCANSKEKNEDIETDPFSLHPSAYQTDFVGYPSDSSWKVSIIYDKLMLLTSKDGSISFRSTEVTEQTTTDSDKVQLSSEVEGEKVTVTIDTNPNKDGSNSFDIVHSKAGKLSGNGRYQGDVRLYNLWTLTHLNQEKVDRSLFTKQPPFMEINLKNGSISGFGGCNDFNGQLSFDYKTFTVDALMSTKKYCGDNSKIENELFKILRGKQIHYTFKNNIVIFESPEGNVTFQKID